MTKRKTWQDVKEGLIAYFTKNKNIANKKRDLLFIIVGPSGTGKTAVINNLCDMYKYNKVKTCTTRKARMNRDDHEFISKEAALDVLNGAKRFYAFTMYNGEYYYVPEDAFINKGVSLVALDVFGTNNLLRSEIRAMITVIYLTASETTRETRMLKRGDAPHEVIARLEYDKIAYGQFKALYTLDTDKWEMREVAAQINNIIEQTIENG